MKKLTAGLVLVAVFAAGFLLGGAVRPAQADEINHIHKISMTLESMERHLDKIANKMPR